jgi:hypothetical protein
MSDFVGEEHMPYSRMWLGAKSQILGAGSQEDARLLRKILDRSGLRLGARNLFDCARSPPFSVAPVA